MDNIPTTQNNSANEQREDIREYTENVAAVMYCWMNCKEAFDEFCEEHGDKHGGHIGIQELAANAAIVFTEEAAIYTAGEDYYWCEAIENFAQKAFTCYYVGENPSVEDLHLFAAGSIEKCRL